METLSHPRIAASSGRADLLVVLTHSVRCLSLRQVARLLADANDAQRAARDLVRRLTLCGLVDTRTVMAHPPLRLLEPIYCCASNVALPDFGALAYEVQSRWRLAPERMIVVQATPRAAALTGGPLPTRDAVRDTELAHDLTLGQIFLEHYLGRDEKLWIPEDALRAEGWPRRDGHVPDSLIRSPLGDTALELAGRSYSAQRLSEIDRAFRGMGYELW